MTIIFMSMEQYKGRQAGRQACALACAHTDTHYFLLPALKLALSTNGRRQGWNKSRKTHLLMDEQLEYLHLILQSGAHVRFCGLQM